MTATKKVIALMLVLGLSFQPAICKGPTVQAEETSGWGQDESNVYDQDSMTQNQDDSHEDTETVQRTEDNSREPATGMTDDTDGLVSTAVFSIDNHNRYKNMKKSYAQGYVPQIKNGYAIVILPLQSSIKLKNNMVSTSLNLGDAQTGPFVYKNYNRNIYLSRNTVNDGSSTIEGYLIQFRLKLKKNRYNGSYPLNIHIMAKDTYGSLLEQDFVVYVNIKDGKDIDETETSPENHQPETESPVFEPKVLIESYHFSKDFIEAGDEIRAKITFVNRSKAESVKNMTVIATPGNENMQLTGKTDTIYIESLAAGAKHVITYKCKMSAVTPPGQYDLQLDLNYADEKGTTYSQTGKVKIDVRQPAKIQFDPLSISPEAEIGDTIEAQVNAMNLGRGKVYNVRAELKADGLSPKGTIFIGDIEAGEMGSGSVQVLISGLTEGDDVYGLANGIVTFYYEDEEGRESKEEQKFSVNIQSPVLSEVQEEDQGNQWWVIMAVIAGTLCIFGVYAGLRMVRFSRKDSNREIGG